MIVVDTNVLSEFMRTSPDPAVAHWLTAAPIDRLAITSISVMEISYGIARLPEGGRKDRTQATWNQLDGAWAGAYFDFSIADALTSGEVMAARSSAGRPMSIPDAQIAGVCLARGAALATRNIKDFEGLGIELINPWER